MWKPIRSLTLWSTDFLDFVIDFFRSPSEYGKEKKFFDSDGNHTPVLYFIDNNLSSWKFS